jgi:putative flippase GtrA
MRPAALAERTGIANRNAVPGRMVRCLSVGGFTTLLSLSVLAALNGVLGVGAVVSNIVATGVGTVPSYVLNRRWVWGRPGGSDPWREVLPFWVLAFTRLAASTVAVGLADQAAAAMGLDGAIRTAALLVANVGAFTALWIGQFLVLDRILFAPEPRAATSTLETSS